MDKLSKYPGRRWDMYINEENQHLVNEEALDLLDKLLVYDHYERILPKEAFEHPYFAPVLEYYNNDMVTD